MPFALVTIGLIAVITGLNGTWGQLSSQVQSDFVPFTKWMLAFGMIGALGYIPDLRSFSHYLLALVLIGMILANKGFFANFQSAINAGPQAPAAPANANAPAPTSKSWLDNFLPGFSQSNYSLQHMMGQ